MTARTFPDGTHKAKRWFAFDSGGIARKGKRVFLFDSGGVARKIFSQEDDLVMIAATNANDFGFASGGFGSVTPNVLGDGATVDQLLLSQHTAANPDTFQLFLLTIPGGAVAASYLTSISLNGTVLVPSGANFSFSSAAGSASWTWTGQRFLFPGGGATVPVVIIRS